MRNTEDGLQRRVQVDYEPDPTGGRLDRVDTITYQQANGTRQLDTLFAYDDLARTTLIHHRRTDESTLEQMEYRYKPNGPLELEQRQGFYSYTLTYDYDPRGQVTTQRFDEGNGPVPTTFAYDSNGNPILSVAPAYGNRVTTTPTGRQLVYEPEGNVIELYDPVASDTWGWRFRMRYDQANRLVETQGGWFLQSGQQWSQALSVRYDYDAEGKLVQRWQEVLATFTLDFGGAQPREFRPDRDTRVERFVYQGEHVAFELNGANQLEVRYLRGDRVDQLWGQFFYDYGGQSWTADWYLTDQQGSVLAQVGDDGRLFKKLRYQGTLADRREGGDWRDRYEYSGRELDYASGQQYHRTRWYAPITGRWLSEDPASPELGHTNPYTYVHNSWPNGTAPNGEVPVDQKWLVPTGNETVRNVVGWLYDHQLPLFLSLDKQDGQKAAAGIWDTAYGFSPFGMFENLAPRDAATGEFNWTFRGEVTNRLWYGAQKDYQGYRKAGYLQADALGYTWMSRMPVLSTVMRLQELDSRFSLQGTSLGQKLTPSDVMLNAFHSIADVATTALALTSFAATIAGPAKAAGGVTQASRWSAVRASVAWRAASATAEAVSLVSGLPLPTAALGSARLALGLAGRGLGLGIKAVLPRLEKGISQAAHAQGQWYQRPMRSVADWMRIEACFAAGTPLRTPDGSKLIDHFQAGDRILSRDETNPDAPVMVSVVEEVFVRLGRIMVLRVGGQVIRTTAEHPFWRKDRGWTPCGELRASDLLCTDGDQWVSVEEVHDTGEYETVYNLRVAEFHTYFVGCDEWGFSVWAHNEYNKRAFTEAAKSLLEKLRASNEQIGNLKSWVRNHWYRNGLGGSKPLNEPAFAQHVAESLMRAGADRGQVTAVLQRAGLADQIIAPGVTKAFEPLAQGGRYAMMGDHPRKNDSVILDEVLPRMQREGTARQLPNGDWEIYSVDPHGKTTGWYPHALTDVGHAPKPAVVYWNETGMFLPRRLDGGPGPELVRWMNAAENLTLQYRGHNRSEGTKLATQGYLWWKPQPRQ